MSVPDLFNIQYQPGLHDENHVHEVLKISVKSTPPYTFRYSSEGQTSRAGIGTEVGDHWKKCGVHN